MREKGIDAVKILASFLVVVLHTMTLGLQDDNNNLGLFIYYMGTFAIPLFFIVTGYLQLRKEKISLKYCFKKIGNIICVAFIYNLILGIGFIILKNEFINPITVTFENLFFQKGLLYHFWFLGTLIVFYLVLPLLIRIFRSNKMYKILTIGLIIISVTVDLLNIRNNAIGNAIIKDTIFQPLRLWSWFMYICIGGAIAKIKITKNIQKKYLWIITIMFIIISVIVEYFFAMNLYGNKYAENFYDNILIIVTSILVFILLKDINYGNYGKIEILGKLVMGIYIFHPIIIKGIKIFYAFDNSILNLLMLAIVYTVSLLISYIISKIPLLNKLIKI